MAIVRLAIRICRLMVVLRTAFVLIIGSSIVSSGFPLGEPIGEVRTAAFAASLMMIASSASAIEYNIPEPIQKLGGKGVLLEAGNDHGIKFQAYLESRQLLVTVDTIYYMGIERVEGIDGDPLGVLRWNYKARCASAPGITNSIHNGIYVSATTVPEQFIDVTEPVVGSTEGFHRFWWAVCRNRFDWQPY